MFSPMRNFFSVYLLLMAAVGLSQVGCGGPSRIEAPEFDAVGAASEAMQLYDEDGDGELSKKELKACDALGKAIEEIDLDQSDTISEEEIKSRIEYFIQGRDGRISVACRIVKGNTPVPSATVTFEPEPFMGDMIQEASGTTGGSGMAVLSIDDELGGVQPGFYKVRISRQSQSGKEMIKKKYNEETVLGQEVTSGSRQAAEGIVFQI